jgi:hypothetical protein
MSKRELSTAALGLDVPYPESSILGSPDISIVSLGPYEGLLSFNTLALIGPLPMRWLNALVKAFIERSKIAQMARNPWADGFWRLADEGAAVAGFLIFAVLRVWLALWLKGPKQKVA